MKLFIILITSLIVLLLLFLVILPLSIHWPFKLTSIRMNYTAISSQYLKNDKLPTYCLYE